MGTPPIEIVGQFPQPTSGSGPSGEREAAEAARPPRAIGSLQEVGFFAHTLTGEARTFSVLAGEGAPTATEGWVKVAKVQRFQRVSLTIPEGYDPYVMTVPIRFDAVALTKRRPNVEAQIQTLEWMAGRSRKGEIVGPPPQVMLYSTDADGNLTNLVPKQFQTVNGSSQQWYLGPITFDPNPLRDRGGDRLRQDATITLTEVVNTEAAIQSQRAIREAVKGKFKVKYTDSAANTIKRVAKREGFPAAWKAILEANRNLGTSGEKRLPNHTKVRIPEVLYRQVAK
jgi:hypothetical protein